MDAFYASVEIRENPELRGKPVVVGGSPESRGVVCAASYEARKFGVRSAIPCSLAKRLCPDAIFVYPNFSLYTEVSRTIRSIFYRYTDLVEPLSLDEAYLDVTSNSLGETSATKIASLIKKEVLEETSLTISCGVSYNKFLAKIASDWKKPDGLFVIRPEESHSFLQNLPIGKFYGVGKVTEKKMKDLGIHSGKELLEWKREDLIRIFGKAGAFYFDIVRGLDQRSVNPQRERKSIGVEDTFSQDSKDQELLISELDRLVDKLWTRMEAKSILGRSLSIKCKYSNFQIKSSTRTLASLIESPEEIRRLAREMFLQTWDHTGSIRLLGISISNLRGEEDMEVDSEQPSLF
jgi:DNA polymerase-4